MDSKTLKIIHLELGYLPVLILLNVFELAFINVVCVFEFVCARKGHQNGLRQFSQALREGLLLGSPM